MLYSTDDVVSQIDVESHYLDSILAGINKQRKMIQRLLILLVIILAISLLIVNCILFFKKSEFFIIVLILSFLAIGLIYLYSFKFSPVSKTELDDPDFLESEKITPDSFEFKEYFDNFSESKEFLLFLI